MKDYLYVRECPLSKSARKDFRIRVEKSNGPVGHYDCWTPMFGNADNWCCFCFVT